MEIKTILITGANGYLGSRLVKALLTRFKIIGLVRNNNIFRLNDIYNLIEIVNVNQDSIENIFNRKIDLIIHTAVCRNEGSLNDMVQSNLIFPLALLEKGIQNDVKHFINLDTMLLRQMNQHTMTKKQFVDWLLFYSDQINVINLQLELFYGPGFNKTNFISIMVNKMLHNEPEIDLTLGEQKRDFLYIDDVISLFDCFVNNIQEFNGFQEFQVGYGKSYSIRYVVELMHKLTNSSSTLNFGKIPYRTNELMLSKPDLKRIRDLNWHASTDLHEGLVKVIEYFKKGLS
jgi:CDP-paratose synthetase